MVEEGEPLMCAPIFDPMPAPVTCAPPPWRHTRTTWRRRAMPQYTPSGEVLARLDRLDELERMNDGGVPYIDLVGGHTGSFIPADGWTQVIFAR